MFVSELILNALGAFLGCVNPGFLYKSLHAVPACQAVDARLGARHRRWTPTIHDFSRPVAAPAFQALDTQLKALPTLPVLARGVSGCLNSGNLDISRQVAVPAFQAMDTQLGARHRRRTPDDSPVNGSFFDDDSLLFLSQPNVKPSHGGPACQTWLPRRPRDIFHPEKSVELV